MELNLLQDFKKLIAKRTGLHLRVQDQQKLSQAIERRQNIARLPTPQEYYRRLFLDQSNADIEWRKFIVLLTTDETFFFRDKGQIALLKSHIIPEIIHSRQRNKRLRIWSAGCSTGEEPYSLAILINELLPISDKWNVFILGTDINEHSIETARTGIYSNWSFRSVNRAIQRRYFTKYNLDWKIDEKIRRMVTFRVGNLRKEKAPNYRVGIYEMDLILCRNVFIYFEPQAISEVLHKFNNTLVKNGYLLTGHSELYCQDLHQFVARSFPCSIVYQKSEPVVKWKGTISDKGVETPKLPKFSALPTVAKNNFPKKKIQSVIQQTECVPESKLNQSDTLFLSAQNFANSGNHTRSIKICQKILEIDPTHIKTHYLLAHIKEEAGAIEEAKSCLKKVIYLEPEYIAAYIELASLYELEDDFKRAKKMWSTGMNLLKRKPKNDLIEPYENVTAEELIRHIKDLISEL
ncbi:MAG: hypothetical protein B6244_03515 [Candidatus Cloacimonetes bacterium 4572_55]|nr:MAG: hypothetical protein B6244_03515 [Candidatus Cloacimonetes bacterium 4572_55]